MRHEVKCLKHKTDRVSPEVRQLTVGRHVETRAEYRDSAGAHSL
jgi:hypothetical protein